MMKVALFVNRVTDYTAPVFRRVADRVSLRVYTYQGEIPTGLEGQSFSHIAPSGYILSAAPGQLLRSRPDVVITGGTNSGVTHLAGAIAIATDTPLVIWTDEWDATQTVQTLALAPIKRKLVGTADAYLACGALQKAFLNDLGADPRHTIIGRYAPCTLPAESEWQAPPELDADTYRKQSPALYFGRLVKRKGPLEVVEAASSSGTNLVVAGDGPLANDINCLSNNAPSVETITRHLDDTEKAWLLANAGITCIPASAEPWGIVIIESLSLGTPVIGSVEVGAAVEHIADGVNGFLVPPLDTEAIEQALNAHDSLPDNVAEFARSSVSRCTVNRQAEAFLAAIENAAEQSQPT